MTGTAIPNDSRSNSQKDKPWASLFHCAQRVFPLLVGAWLLVHLAIVGRAVLPLPEPWQGKWPWGMFRTASDENRMLFAEGKIHKGRWVSIPLQDFFHYTRGATDLRIYEHAHAFWKKGDKKEREKFAIFLADQMSAKGVSFTEIRFFWERTHLETKRTRRQFLGHFLLDPDR